MKRYLVAPLVAVVAVAMAADVWAQGRGFGRGAGFGGFGGGGIGRGALLRLESVQEELGVEEVQLEDIRAMQAEMRRERPDRGDRPNFRDMSEQEREEFMAQRREEAAERQKKELEMLADILDDQQYKRLNGIYVQVAGVAALQDPMVREEVNISDEQIEEIQQATRDAMADLRGQFQPGGDREAMRERMAEVRSKIEEAAMGVLSDEQQSTLASIKGEPFELSEEDQQALRGRRGGRGGQGGPAGPGGRRGRPQQE